MAKVTRGVRNNNPFNIKISKSSWLGKKSVNTDGTFEQFETMCYGLRAGVKLLANYICSGYDTPRAIISRFAPSSENNTKAYLDYLESKGLLPDQRIVLAKTDFDINNYRFGLLCSLICFYESRYDVLPLRFIEILKGLRIL